MMRNFRKVISIVCVIAILMSLCVISMVENTAAAGATTYSSPVTLNFDNGKGIAATRSGKLNNQVKYVTEPTAANASNKAVSVYSKIGAEVSIVPGSTNDATYFATTASNFLLEPGVTYKLSYKWKAKAGYFYSHASADAWRASPINYIGLEVKDVPDSVGDPSPATYTAYGTAGANGNPTGTSKSQALVVNATNGTQVGDNTNYFTLNSDSDWFTEEVTFTWDAKFGETIALFVRNGSASDTSTYKGGRTVVIDDISLAPVVNPASIDIDYKKEGTSTPWAPNKHEHLANSTDAKVAGATDWKSHVDANNVLHITTYQHSAFSKTGLAWENQAIVYDPDLPGDGFYKLSSGKTYAVTFQYKVSASKQGGGQIAVGYIDGLTSSNKNKTIKNSAFVACTNTDPKVESGTWQKFTVVFEATSDMNGKYLTLIASTAQGTPTGSTNSDKFTQILIKSLNIKELNTDGMITVSFNTNGGNEIDTIFTEKGVNVANILPIPTNADTNKSFAGWYKDAELKQPVGSSWNADAGTYTVYAKWSSIVSYITLNNSGVVSQINIKGGTPLARPERPNGQLFFEGWYTEPTFENKVTVAPDYDCTLYAKYNNLYIPFNNGGISDGNAMFNIVDDPDVEGNKVLHAYTLQNSSSPNIEIGSYDAAKDQIVPFSIKPSTKYTVSYRVKMKGGDNSGANLKLHIGSEDLGVYPNSSKYMIAQASFTVQQCKDGTDWVNVSHTFETNDTLYYERVNFTYMNHLYIILNSVDAAGSSNSSVINMYIDDLTVIEHTDKIPEGAVAVYYETNGSKINPSFGYAGEKYIAPQNPTAQGGKFLGWYTDKSLTKPFTSTTFPSSNITLYAKWEDAQWIIKFDTYSTTGMSGRYNLTKEGDNNVLRYNYEQGKASSTAAASAFARATLNTGMGNEYSVVKGVQYTIKFRIKVLKEGFKEGGYANAVTHVINNTWIESVQHDIGIAITQANDEWVTMEGKFVAAQRVDNANYLSIAFSGDYTALIDDIEVSSAVNPINIYGSNVIYFNSNGGPGVSPISGDPGDPITLPKPAARDGYSFKGWYTDQDCTKKFTGKTYSQENLTLYAGWVLGSFSESFENLPISVQLQGIGGGYKLYDKSASGYNAANVNNGATSIFRDGATAGTKAFTVCRDAAFNLEKGEQYTISFYVKPTNVTDANGVINLVGMANNMSIAIPESTDVITSVGTLKANEWQKVSYTFTANSRYVGISTTPGNDMYMDNFTVQLNGYTGSPTGDESVSPIIILSMIVLAAGAIMFTSKKVFAN